MLTAKSLLLDKEVLIGEYNIEVARWSDNRWNSTVPPLYAVLTDMRLILQPQALKKREPAIIPTHYIIHIKPFTTTNRHGVILSLKNDQKIAIFIQTHQHEEIMRNLRSVAISAMRSEKRFNASFDVSAVEKMIDHIKQI
ncbi:MAG: hypothetical protein SH821_18075 [Phototrophicales bacterium]|nr:hypothetical protein [Phototrophicales bacterium]